MTSDTPLSRRSFLGRLVGAAAVAPLVAAAAKQEPDPIARFVDGPPGPIGVLVKGLAIKVPSNRVPYYTLPAGDAPDHHRYYGDWDGTFKLERGCTNPAWILADLYERTGAEPDWVVKRRWAPGLYRSDAHRLLKPVLNWQMLYDWGVWCDGPIDGFVPDDRFTRSIRMVASTADCRTHQDLVQLRETLRMHCLSWQSTDPRYRASYPGIPYPHSSS